MPSELTKFNFGSWDLLIFLFLAVISVGYTFFFVSHGKLAPLLVSAYMAFVLVKYAPFAVFQEFPAQLLAFGVILLVGLFVLSRVIFQSPVGAETFGVLSAFFLSLSQTGFLAAVLVSLLSPEIISEFSNLTTFLFVGSKALFFWALAPVALLLFLGAKVNREVG